MNSTGLDRTQTEFNQCFRKDLHVSTMFHSMMKETYTNDVTSYPQKSQLFLLYIKKGSKRQFKKYWPISLTNTDYKINAFIFARRLKNIIDKCISSEPFKVLTLSNT